MKSIMGFGLASMLAACAVPAKGGQEEGFVSIFNGKDLSGWTYHLRASGENQDGLMKMADVWSAADGVITCKGRPPGYIRTTKDYTNYVLRLEWRWPEKPGNSGVLLRMTGEDKVWPKSIEAQLASGHAADFWLIGGAVLDTPKERYDKNPKRQRHRIHLKANEKKPGEWNAYDITVNRGEVSLKVNGEVINGGTGAEEIAGKICLQSEGSVIQFRNIRIKELK